MTTANETAALPRYYEMQLQPHQQRFGAWYYSTTPCGVQVFTHETNEMEVTLHFMTMQDGQVEVLLVRSNVDSPLKYTHKQFSLRQGRKLLPLTVVDEWLNAQLAKELN